MEQDVDTVYRGVCCTCLSSDRNLLTVSLTCLPHIYQVFRLLMYDFAGDRYGENIQDMEQYLCWECLALMKRFLKFKRQVHSAQEHLRVLAMSRGQESLDHTYMSQSLSTLDETLKEGYDKVFYEYTMADRWDRYIIHTDDEQHYNVAEVVRTNIDLDGTDDAMDANILNVPELVLENPVTGVMSHIVVTSDGTGDMLLPNVNYASNTKGNVQIPMIQVSISPLAQNKVETVIMKDDPEDKSEPKHGYISEYLSEEDMLACREEAKQKLQYASAMYKCELCIIGFYTQQQVEDHFVAMHRPKPEQVPCKICFVYIPPKKLQAHVDSHYARYKCKMCAHAETSTRAINAHIKTHIVAQQANNVIKIGEDKPSRGRSRRQKGGVSHPPKPGDLRKLLSKTTIEGYQCLECDMFFKNSRARKNHVARFHREGLECDHCKKRFVNRTTLATHLRLHEGPLPREKCPICHKLVRVIQLKYHIQRHQNKSRYECEDCQKVFSHLATYQAHLKYSRAHASDEIFKFPCPMCNKGYPSKEAMQDHFNYQHLGKTSHKCPICEKPIASKANVEKHMMRVHGEKKEKPRNHVCQQCGKAFTDRKALTQHEVIHSGDRPLTCDICHQTFKQKASLYTHRRRVHKVVPSKRVIEFMDKKEAVQSSGTATC